jgi:hypothetical protein
MKASNNVIAFDNTKTYQKIRQSLINQLTNKYSYTYVELSILDNRELTILLNTEKEIA